MKGGDLGSAQTPRAPFQQPPKASLIKRGLRAVDSRMFALLGRVLLGAHPRNTFLAFNWHNVRHILQFLESRRPVQTEELLRIVDVGGGRCPYYHLFSGSAREYVCVDMFDGWPGVDDRPILWLEGMAEFLPLKDGSCDLVICNQVLEHVLKPEAACSELFRVLKPGGVLLGSVPHASPVHLEPHDFRRLTDLGVKQLLGDAGFDSVEVSGNGGAGTAAALILAMDWVLSPRMEGRPQYYLQRRAVLLSPLIGLLNLSGLLLDFVLPSTGRMPANLCFQAVRRA